MSELAHNPVETAKAMAEQKAVNNWVDIENGGSMADFQKYIEGRPTEASDADYAVDNSHAPGEYGDGRNVNSHVINERIEGETLADTDYSYKHLTMAELAKERAEARISEDARKQNQVEKVLNKKVKAAITLDDRSGETAEEDAKLARDNMRNRLQEVERKETERLTAVEAALKPEEVARNRMERHEATLETIRERQRQEEEAQEAARLAAEEAAAESSAPEDEVAKPSREDVLRMIKEATDAAQGDDPEATRAAQDRLNAALSSLSPEERDAVAAAAAEAAASDDEGGETPESPEAQPTAEQLKAEINSLITTIGENLNNEDFDHAGTQERLNELLVGIASQENWGNGDPVVRALEMRAAKQTVNRNAGLISKDERLTLTLPEGMDADQLQTDLADHYQQAMELAAAAEADNNEEEVGRQLREALRLATVQHRLGHLSDEQFAETLDSLNNKMGVPLLLPEDENLPEDDLDDTEQSDEIEEPSLRQRLHDRWPNARMRVRAGIAGDYGAAFGRRERIEGTGEEYTGPLNRREKVAAVVGAVAAAVAVGFIGYKTGEYVNNQLFDSGDNFDNLLRHGMTPDQAHDALNNQPAFERVFESRESVQTFGSFLEWADKLREGGLTNDEIIDNLKKLKRQ